MPTVPEILNIPTNKWLIKVFRSLNTHHIANTNGKSTITSKIKKQIKTIGVHIVKIILKVTSSNKTKISNKIVIYGISDNIFIEKSYLFRHIEELYIVP